MLLAGQVVADVSASFERFWTSGLAVAPEQIYAGLSPVDDAALEAVRRSLHDYARSPENFSPTVRAAIENAATSFPRLASEAWWGRVDYICDLPGKNDEQRGLGGGGRSGEALRQLVAGATERVVVQSPYLVLSDRAWELFRDTIARGVRIRINTNSLASTDNLQAFAGYRNQRSRLLGLGLTIFEYRPDAASARESRARALVAKLPAASDPTTVFGLHAKTMVVDSKATFIGTFNLDPRSENLNTEVGVVIYSERLSRAVETSIENDMSAANSWNAADNPDQHVPFSKRAQVLFWQMMPITPLL